MKKSQSHLVIVRGLDGRIIIHSVLSLHFCAASRIAAVHEPLVGSMSPVCPHDPQRERISTRPDHRILLDSRTAWIFEYMAIVIVQGPEERIIVALSISFVLSLFFAQIRGSQPVNSMSPVCPHRDVQMYFQSKTQSYFSVSILDAPATYNHREG